MSKKASGGMKPSRSTIYKCFIVEKLEHPDLGRATRTLLCVLSTVRPLSRKERGRRSQVRRLDGQREAMLGPDTRSPAGCPGAEASVHDNRRLTLLPGSASTSFLAGGNPEQECLK